MKFYAIFIRVLVYPAALYIFKLFYKLQFFGIDAIRIESKDPGPEGPALISSQRDGVYLRLRME
jgi:hypothetical protein